MKKILFIILIIPLLSSCGQKEGCTDTKALNFDFEATKDNGSCIYSSVTFYASNKVWPDQTTIKKIYVTVNGTHLGSIDTEFYEFGFETCEESGTLSYKFDSGEEIHWMKTIFYENGDTFNGVYTYLPPDKTDRCLKVNLTP